MCLNGRKKKKKRKEKRRRFTWGETKSESNKNGSKPFGRNLASISRPGLLIFDPARATCKRERERIDAGHKESDLQN